TWQQVAETLGVSVSVAAARLRDWKSTPEMVARAHEMFAGGATPEQVGRVLGVPASAARSWLVAAGESYPEEVWAQRAQALLDTGLSILGASEQLGVSHTYLVGLRERGLIRGGMRKPRSTP